MEDFMPVPKLTPLYRHHGLQRMAFDVISSGVIETVRKVDGVLPLTGNTFLIKSGRDPYSTYQRVLKAIADAEVK
jgi:hypothetical protein